MKHAHPDGVDVLLESSPTLVGCGLVMKYTNCFTLYFYAFSYKIYRIYVKVF